MSSVDWYGQDRASRAVRAKVHDKWMAPTAPSRHVDPILVSVAVLLSAVGLVAVFSATQARLELSGQSPMLFASRQGLSLGLALVAMVGFALVDYDVVRRLAWAFYLVVLGLLVAVLAIGQTVNGATRWIQVGGFQVQPSEFAKLAVILVLAALFHAVDGPPRLRHVLVALVLVAVPMGLIFLEPDLGTAIVFAWLTFVMLLVAGVRYRLLVGLGIAGIAGAVMAFRQGLIQPYQLQRILSFLDAGSADLARTSGFHTNQAQIAIGSGQFLGRGLYEGTQTKLAYVPENHTDFIFTVIGEELGFVGAAFVVGLFAILLFRALRIASLARDTFGTLVAAGAVGLLTLQVFVNIGMTVGIMPVTGIPLPFISYGTNALIVMFALVGLLLNIHMRRFTPAD